MINRKAQNGLGIQALIIGLLVAGLAMTSYTLFLGGFSVEYNVTGNTSSLSGLTRYSELNETIGNVGSIVTSEEEGFIDTALGPIDEVFSAGFSSLRLLIEVPTYYYTALSTSLSEILKVSPQVVNVVFLILLAIVILSIVTAVTRIP